MSAYVSVALRRRVSEHFAHCCAYCRTAENLSVAIFECEHIVPQSVEGNQVIRFKKLQPIRCRHLLLNVWLVECRRGGKTMTIEQVLNDISALPPSDQLRVVQAIWDRLPEGVGTELTAAQQAELDRRWADYKADPSTALTEDEFRARIRIARGR